MKRAAFSLIEVNVAILVIAGGMLSLFTLFPAGLRMSTSAMGDTRQALFADDFFAYFETGLQDIEDSLSKWENIEEFREAGMDGVRDGFRHAGYQLSDFDAKWPSSEIIDSIRKSWDGDLKSKDFETGGANSETWTLCVRFRSGIVKDYFSSSSSTDLGKLDAEFVVRIAGLYGASGDSVDNATYYNGDCRIWRVSLIVSDEGANGWFYDNSVYHREFRFSPLP